MNTTQVRRCIQLPTYIKKPTQSSSKLKVGWSVVSTVSKIRKLASQRLVWRVVGLSSDSSWQCYILPALLNAISSSGAVVTFVLRHRSINEVNVKKKYRNKKKIKM